MIMPCLTLLLSRVRLKNTGVIFFCCQKKYPPHSELSTSCIAVCNECKTVSAWDNSMWLSSSFQPLPVSHRPEGRLASAGIWFPSLTVLQSSSQSCSNVSCESQLNTACRPWPVLAGQSQLSPATLGNNLHKERLNLFSWWKIWCQKNFKILLQKVACLFHGCRERFNRLKTTAPDWKCNSGSKNAFCNPFVWEFFASACFGQHVLYIGCIILRLSHAQICRNWIHYLKKQSQKRIITAQVSIYSNKQLLQKLYSRHFPPLLKQISAHWVVLSPHLCTSAGLRVKPWLCSLRLKPCTVASASSWV